MLRLTLDNTVLLFPGLCSDGIDKLVAASSESYVCNSTPQGQPRSVAMHKCVALASLNP